MNSDNQINFFMALGQGMELYRNETDQQLGAAIGLAARIYDIGSKDVANLLRAISLTNRAPEWMQFCMIVVDACQKYESPEAAQETLQRLIEYMDKVSTIEDLEVLVAQLTHPGNSTTN